MVSKEDWGLKKMAYEIQNKNLVLPPFRIQSSWRSSYCF
jgi:hypothetical protein